MHVVSLVIGRLRKRPWVWLLPTLMAGFFALAGCQSLGYYGQSVNGHLRLMNATRPVQDWLNDPTTTPALHTQLALAQQLRAYASESLHLPRNASYHAYASVPRGAAVWNVTAAPPDSLALKQWCFVVLGCVSYRGYFDENEAQSLGRALAQQGWEVDVYPVPAYSTLGKLNWLGGDPVLSTFVGYPEADLAGLLFHELAHQQLYVDHDSAFNESFATAVERLGVRQWLQTRPDAVRVAYQQSQAHRHDFRAVQLRTRDALAALYAQAPSLPEGDLLAQKARVMADFVDHYRALQQTWAAMGEPDARFDRWVTKANNASFGLQAVYQGWVPAFEALFEREAADWPRFYAAAQQLGNLPRAERDAALQTLMPKRAAH